MKELINQVTLKDYDTAYKYGGGMTVCLLLSGIFRAYGFYVGQNFLVKIKATLISALYHKVNNLSQYSIKQANIGKIVTIISNELSGYEGLFSMQFYAYIFPFTIFGAGVIMWLRLGPIGITSLGLMLLVVPIQKWISLK